MRASLTSDHVVSGLGTAHWVVSFLAAGKLLHVLGVASLYSCLLGLPVLQALFTTKSIAAACLAAIQRPFAGPPLTTHLQVKVVRRCLADVLLSVLWMYSLTLCGPLRTVLLYGQVDAVPVAVLAAVFSGKRWPARVRGAALYALAVVALLLFDHDAPPPPPEAAAQLPAALGVSDHKGGVLLLLLATALRAAYDAAGRKLAVEVGGGKRLQTLVTLGSAALLLPAALLSCFLQTAAVDSVAGWLPTLVFLALVLHVLDFYVESVSGNRLEAAQVARVTCLVQTAAALGLSGLWQTDTEAHPAHHGLSAGVVASALLFAAATFALTAPAGGGTRGQFVGYSAAGLPLYSVTSARLQEGSRSAAAALRALMSRVRADPTSRRLFCLLCLNVGFMCVEFTYGVWTNSLSLISDGFHMLFDCSALVLGLAASVVAQWKPTRQFPYGYGRVEVLSGFVNALFLLVVAYMVFMESLHRLMDTPDIKTDRLLMVSVLGLLVNVAGLLMLGGAHSHSHSHHGHAHAQNANLRGVYLHVLSDTLGSVGVVISALLVRHVGWTAADAVCSLLISALMAVSVAPLLRQTALVLVLRAPPDTTLPLRQTLSKVLLLEGVQSYSDPHFWSHSTDKWVGTLHVQVKDTADEQQIVGQVTSLFKKLGFRTFAVQVEKAEFVSRKLSARGSYSLGLVDRTAMFDAEVLSSVKSI